MHSAEEKMRHVISKLDVFVYKAKFKKTLAYLVNRTCYYDVRVRDM